MVINFIKMDRLVPTVGVIKGHQDCQTKDAKWLCLENLFHKLYRPNLFDIGGTHIDGMADFWFVCRTERVGKLFLLHILITSRRESTFDVSISSSNNIVANHKINVIFLNENLKNFKFSNVEEMATNYVTTYSFTEIDVESFKNRKVYIPICFYGEVREKLGLEYVHSFESLLKDPVGADFVIESSDGHKYPVHRVLLIAVSKVFEAMLKDQTAESQNSCLKLVDVNKEDLLCILEFIYTGTVKDIENNDFVNILILADRYDLNILRELSEVILSSQLSLDNVVEFLSIADMSNAPGLKSAAFNYIKANPEALNSTIFKELKNPGVLQELCKFIAPTNQ